MIESRIVYFIRHLSNPYMEMEGTKLESVTFEWPSITVRIAYFFYCMLTAAMLMDKPLLRIETTTESINN